MTLDDAWKELGVSPSAGRDEVRRAYLRLLKTRKPEVDAEGFMRLREAYELARERAEFLERLPQWHRISEVPASEQPNARPASNPSDDEGPADDGPAESSEAEDEPPKAAEETVARPAAPEVEEKVDEGDGDLRDNQPEEAEPAAEPAEAHEAAVPEVPPWGDGPMPDEARIDELLKRREYQAAAQELERYFVWGRADHDVQPPVPQCLRVLLGLHEKGKLARADSLLRSFCAWLEATGRERKVRRGDGAVVWQLVRELSALPPRFPREVRAALARAIEVGDLNRAIHQMLATRDANQGEAVQAAGLLRVHAPTIAGVHADLLDPPRQKKPSGSSSSGASFGWIVVVMFMGLLRVLASGSHGSVTSTPVYDPMKYSYSRPYATIDRDAVDRSFREAAAAVSAQLATLPKDLSPKLLQSSKGEVQRLLSDVEQAAMAESMRLEQTSDRHGDKTLKAVNLLSTAVDNGDCLDAEKRMKELSKSPPRGKDGGLVDLAPLGRALLAYCRTIPLRRGPSSGSTLRPQAAGVRDGGRVGP